MGLVAALGWASYILLNRRLGQQLPGLQGTATASLVTAGVWLPIAVIWFSLNPPPGHALALAAVCGVLSSVIPYACDLLALRRVATPVFGTITNCNPVWAVLVGWLLLHQTLDANEWVGILLIVVSNVVVAAGPHLWAGTANRSTPARASGTTS